MKTKDRGSGTVQYPLVAVAQGVDLGASTGMPVESSRFASPPAEIQVEGDLQIAVSLESWRGSEDSSSLIGFVGLQRGPCCEAYSTRSDSSPAKEPCL